MGLQEICSALEKMKSAEPHIHVGIIDKFINQNIFDKDLTAEELDNFKAYMSSVDKEVFMELQNKVVMDNLRRVAEVLEADPSAAEESYEQLCRKVMVFLEDAENNPFVKRAMSIIHDDEYTQFMNSFEDAANA